MLQKKISFGVLVGAFLATILFVPVASAAQDSSNTIAAQKAAKLAERVANYKTKQAVKLAAAEETKLKGSCKAAQAKVKALTTKSTAAYTARTKLFTAITTKVTSIKSGLQDAEIDTKDLESAEAAFDKTVADYKTAYETLKADLADTAELDCVTDPAAFKAALLTARADRQTMADKAKTVVDSIPTIRAALVAARQELAKSNTTDTTEPTSTGAAQ